MPSLKVVRSDEFGAPHMINDKIIEALEDFEIAVADLTGLNPNVFYEIGVRHMYEKPVIHIASMDTKIPFDNFASYTIQYDIMNVASHRKVVKEIASAIEQIHLPGYSVSNPVTQARASIKLARSSDPKDRQLAQLEARLTDNELAIRRLQRFEDFASRFFNVLAEPPDYYEHGRNALMPINALMTRFEPPSAGTAISTTSEKPSANTARIAGAASDSEPTKRSD